MTGRATRPNPNSFDQLALMPRRTSNQPGIYAIRHLQSGKLYVGSANDLERRFIEHRTTLDAKKHPNRHLQRAWNKYGNDAFTFEVLEYVEDARRLVEREQHWLDRTESYKRPRGYNLAHRAQSMLGYKHSTAARRRMSKAHIGYDMPIDQRKKISRALKGNKEHSKQARRKLSEAHAVLSKGDVYAVLDKYYYEEMSQTAVSQEYPISLTVIASVVKGKKYIHWVASWKKDRGIRQFPVRAHGRSTLQTEDYFDILDRLRRGEERQHIAKLYGLSKPQITAIAKGRTHKQLYRAWISAARVTIAERRGLEERFSKLVSKDVEDIKRLIRLGKKQKDIATTFGVSPSTISDIKHGRR